MHVHNVTNILLCLFIFETLLEIRASIIHSLFYFLELILWAELLSSWVLPWLLAVKWCTVFIASEIELEVKILF